MAHASKTAVVTAIAANAAVTLTKFGAAALSGSAAMMNEAVHSLMDTLNQAFLFLGLRAGERPADRAYAFGHGQKKYLWNLWSAIGLFSVGAGVGLAHAWHSWQHLSHAGPEETVTILGRAFDPFHINLVVLATAFLLEGISFVVASREFIHRMRADGRRNPARYLFESNDPTLVAVVLEDSVAMIGLCLATAGVVLSRLTAHGGYDVAFSALIALMLGVVAFYLGWTNMRFLADLRDRAAEKVFQRVALAHRQVERCHDLRSIVIDEHHTLIVAEIELREEAIAPDLLGGSGGDTRSPGARVSTESVVAATLARAEQIIDEIEAAVRAEMPRVSHITVEIEGIGPRRSLNRD